VVVRKEGAADSGPAAATPETVSARAGESVSLECVSEGANPAPRLSWRLRGTPLQPAHQQHNERSAAGLWRSVSRLSLPVSREDHGYEVTCEVEHPATPSINGSVRLNIFYPPRVTAHTSVAGPLTEGSAAAVTLTCEVESNPPGVVSWRRVGGQVVGSGPSLTLQPVRRELAGGYQCQAENELGLSQPATVQLDVQCKSSITITISLWLATVILTVDNIILLCKLTAFFIIESLPVM
jgi:hypothetical protein